MKVLTRYHNQPKDICDAVAESLEGDSDCGELENLRESNYNMRRAFGNLLEIMAEQGHINAEQLSGFLATHFTVTD